MCVCCMRFAFCVHVYVCVSMRVYVCEGGGVLEWVGTYH